MLSVEKYQSTSGHHGRFPCCFTAKPRGGGQGEGAGSAQKQEGCACVQISEWEKDFYWMFSSSSLSRNVSTKWLKARQQFITCVGNVLWDEHSWLGGVLFLKCISSFSVPLHSFSHWHCRNLFGLSPSDHKINMQICIFDIKSPRNLYRPVGKEVPRCCAHLINVL